MYNMGVHFTIPVYTYTLTVKVSHISLDLLQYHLAHIQKSSIDSCFSQLAGHSHNKLGKWGIIVHVDMFQVYLCVLIFRHFHITAT